MFRRQVRTLLQEQLGRQERFCTTTVFVGSTRALRTCGNVIYLCEGACGTNRYTLPAICTCWMFKILLKCRGNCSHKSSVNCWYSSNSLHIITHHFTATTHYALVKVPDDWRGSVFPVCWNCCKILHPEYLLIPRRWAICLKFACPWFWAHQTVFGMVRQDKTPLLSCVH